MIESCREELNCCVSYCPPFHTQTKPQIAWQAVSLYCYMLCRQSKNFSDFRSRFWICIDRKFPSSQLCRNYFHNIPIRFEYSSHVNVPGNVFKLEVKLLININFDLSQRLRVLFSLFFENNNYCHAWANIPFYFEKLVIFICWRVI